MDEHSIFCDLDSKRPMLDIHKNPLLVSILTGCEILKAMNAKDMLPQDIMTYAKGFLIMKTDKVGFGISITQGYGLVIAKSSTRASGWSAPLPVKVDGFSLGAVIGFSEQQTLIALANDDDINAFKAEKRAMKLGVDIGLSLGDKYNKTLGMDTQNIQSGEHTKTKAFTISKGMLVDVAFKGASVEADMEDIANSYGKQVTPADILSGTAMAPREAALLYGELRKVMEKYSAAAS